MPDQTSCKPKRPPNVEYASMCDLFLAFENLFLCTGGIIHSACGQDILSFDHHFFHMAAITVPGVETKLLMSEEKQGILALTDGFGKFEIKEPRARHLSSAIITLTEPDEVWQNNPKSRAKWVYIKEWDSLPYCFSVALVTERPEENGIIVPVSSFPCKRSDAKKWRAGELIYSVDSINTKAAQS